jgi:hypothetical protein
VRGFIKELLELILEATHILQQLVDVSAHERLPAGGAGALTIDYTSHLPA